MIVLPATAECLIAEVLPTARTEAGLDVASSLANIIGAYLEGLLYAVERESTNAGTCFAYATLGTFARVAPRATSARQPPACLPAHPCDLGGNSQRALFVCISPLQPTGRSLHTTRAGSTCSLGRAVPSPLSNRSSDTSHLLGTQQLCSMVRLWCLNVFTSFPFVPVHAAEMAVLNGPIDGVRLACGFECYPLLIGLLSSGLPHTYY